MYRHSCLYVRSKSPFIFLVPKRFQKICRRKSWQCFRTVKTCRCRDTFLCFLWRLLLAFRREGLGVLSYVYTDSRVSSMLFDQINNFSNLVLSGLPRRLFTVYWSLRSKKREFYVNITFIVTLIFTKIFSNMTIEASWSQYLLTKQLILVIYNLFSNKRPNMSANGKIISNSAVFGSVPTLNTWHDTSIAVQ